MPAIRAQQRQLRGPDPGRQGLGTGGTAGTTTPAGLAPADLQQAYDLQGTTSGSGQTVAVVTPYNDPTAASDLAAYRSQYGLTPCTAANGCFNLVSQTGSTHLPLPGTSAEWNVPIAESVDAISAVCPNCHILVVEANSDAITTSGGQERGSRLGAKFIDNDWTIPDSASETTDDTYFDHPASHHRPRWRQRLRRQLPGGVPVRHRCRRHRAHRHSSARRGYRGRLGDS